MWILPIVLETACLVSSPMNVTDCDTWTCNSTANHRFLGLDPLLEQSAHMILVVAYAELLLDNLGDAVQVQT